MWLSINLLLSAAFLGFFIPRSFPLCCFCGLVRGTQTATGLMWARFCWSLAFIGVGARRNNNNHTRGGRKEEIKNGRKEGNEKGKRYQGQQDDE